MTKEWDVIIVGGGIGGLSCAHFLRRTGLQICVLERSPGLNEVGAGLQLAPNALLALQEIGLLHDVLPLGWKMQTVELRSTRSGLLSALNAGHETLLAIHRAQLQKILARDVSDSLRFGVKIQTIQQDDDRVDVHLESGEILQARALIGADGLRSQVRSQLFPPVNYRYSGTSSYRGIVSAPGLLRQPHMGAEIWGPGCRLGYSPLNANDIYWYLTFDAPPQEQRSPEACKIHALQWMQHFPEERSLIERTDPAHIIHTDIGDMKPTSHWVEGRVALMGDAAHATTPNLGQGAAQAIEDAWALGIAMRKFGPEPIALQAYHNARENKALWIVRQSWNFQSLCHIQRPWLQTLRDWLVKYTPASVREASLKRIYKPEVGLFIV